MKSLLSVLAIIFLPGARVSSDTRFLPVAASSATAMPVYAYPLEGAEDDFLVVTDGNLRLTGAWTLISDNIKFGGISGMAILSDAMLLLSDKGNLFRISMHETGMNWADISVDWPDQCGKAGMKETDAESVALSADKRTILVSLEGANSLCKYPLINAKARPWSL